MKMFFWVREIAGWSLILLAVVLIRFAVIFLSQRQVVEAGVLVLIMLATLRAGVLLIRISTAARLALITRGQGDSTKSSQPRSTV